MELASNTTATHGERGTKMLADNDTMVSESSSSQAGEPSFPKTSRRLC